MTVIYFTYIFFFLILCALLCTVIMLQEPKGGGLGSAFGAGGGDATDAVFGASTADVLKKFTGYMAIIFVVSCIILSMWTAALGRNHSAASQASLETLIEGAK